MQLGKHPLAERDLENLPQSVKRKFEKLRFKIIEEFDYTSLLRTKILWPVPGYQLLSNKIRVRRVRYRALGFVSEAKYWLLHVFEKDTRKLQKKNIETALSRKRDIALVEEFKSLRKQL